MTPKLKKILKWVGLFYLAIFMLGIVSMTFEHFGKSLVPAQRNASRNRDVYRRTFAGPFVESYDGQGEWKAARKLHFLKNGLAVYEYISGSDAVTMDLFDYRTEGDAIELGGVESFEVSVRHGDMGRSYNTFRRTGRRPAGMRVEPMLSKRGRDIRVFVEGIDEPMKFHQSTPVGSIHKRTLLSQERVFLINLYTGAYADRMSGIWTIDKGDYDLLTPYPGADSAGARLVGDQQRLLALMKSRSLRSEPFEIADRRAAFVNRAADFEGTFNGLWAGRNAAWAFLPLTAILILLGILSICGYGEPDERRYRMFGMSLFHRISLAVVIISAVLLVWYVASLGGMCLWFLSIGFPFSIINGLLALVFCSLLCSLMNMEHVELVSFYGVREPRGGWIEALVAYGITGMVILGVINSAVAGDGMELPAPGRILAIYLLLVLVTLPRTLLRIRRCSGPKALLLLFFLFCYPLRYPLFVIHLISAVINGVGSIKSSDPEEEEPDHMYVTDVFGNAEQIHKMPNGEYMDNNGNRWNGSGRNYYKVGSGRPFSR